MKRLTVLLFTVLLMACGDGGSSDSGGGSSDSGGGSSDSGGGSSNKKYSASGTIVRESLAQPNSEVYIFADENENGVLDDGEAYTTADAYGNYTLNYEAKSEALIVAQVQSSNLGGDFGANATKSYYLYTPKGENLISSYTTLIYRDMAQNGVTIEQAKSNLSQKTGLSGNDIFNKDSYVHENAVASKYIAASIEKFTETLIAKGMTPTEAQNLMNLICDAVAETLLTVINDIKDNGKTVIPPKDDVVVDDFLVELSKGMYAISVDVKKWNGVITDVEEVMLYGYKYKDGYFYQAEMILEDVGKKRFPHGKVLTPDSLIYIHKVKFDKIADNKYNLMSFQNQDCSFVRVAIASTTLHGLISKDTTQPPVIDSRSRLKRTVDLTGVTIYDPTFKRKPVDFETFDITEMKADSDVYDIYNSHGRNFNSIDEYITFLKTCHQPSWDFTYTDYTRDGFTYIVKHFNQGDFHIVWADGNKFYRRWVEGTEPYNPNDRNAFMSKAGIEKVLATYFKDIF